MLAFFQLAGEQVSDAQRQHQQQQKQGRGLGQQGKDLKRLRGTLSPIKYPKAPFLSRRKLLSKSRLLPPPISSSSTNKGSASVSGVTTNISLNCFTGENSRGRFTIMGEKRDKQ